MTKDMIRRIAIICLLFLFLSLAFGQVNAQDTESPEFQLNVKRNFGFSSGSQIRGNFTNSIVGPTNTIRSVTFLIDGQEMATVTDAPFSFKYETGTYALGWHEMSARVTTQDGRTVETPVRRFNFVSSEEEFAVVRNLIIPLLGGIFLLMFLGMGAQMLLMRNKNTRLAPGTRRQYGLRGGTVCSRCERPFSIHLWALNFGLWRLDRCDYCGKWSFVRRMPEEILRAAEQAELARAQAEIPTNSNLEEETRRKLDESRYIDPE